MDGLPDRYLAEIRDPRTAFAGDLVLLGTALAHAAEGGVPTVRLSVWKWRTGAVALYERFGFTVTESRDERDELVCMQRTA